MGKNKRQKMLNGGGPKKNKPNGKGAKPTGITKPQQPRKLKKKHTQIQHSIPTIPFSPLDSILLIGEGDLSFARSLVETHHCCDVVATVYEKEEELREKYPHVGENIIVLEEGGVRVRYGVDAMKGGPVWKEVRGRMDRVVFNFPHVGGKTKDVNRQVRYNQELLVAFFQNALQALKPSTEESISSVVVTLFEGEPYTLWNIRDLARHSGLQLEKSFKFQAMAYPGYKHARTLGVVKDRNGESGGGWRGEERSSRSYIFVRKGEATEPGQNEAGKKKDDSSSDEEDENMGGNGQDGEIDGSGSDVWDGIHGSGESEQEDDD